jgi:hypothetical protein
VFIGLLLILGAGLFALYQGMQYIPEAYARALEVDRVTGQRASDAMLQQVTALRNNVRKAGDWHVLFTAEQINGWLAVDLVENHPDELPDDIRDPRVAIEPEQMLLFCTYRWHGHETVVTLAVQPFLHDRNVLGLRIRKGRAGRVPFPLQKIIEQIPAAVAQSGFHVQWQQADGDPVVLITVPPPRGKDDKQIEITAIRLGEGEIYFEGLTKRSAGNK